MKALVVGATGARAGLVVPALKRHGVAVRGLVRDPSREQLALDRGVDEVAYGDLNDFMSLTAAAAGVDAVFHINPAFAPGESEIGVRMVRAAEAAKVRKFVFSSVYHASIGSLSNHVAKQATEEALYESALDFTVLQPAMFMQNLLNPVRTAEQTGILSMPYSISRRTSWVDFRDVAEVAARAIAFERLSRGTFELSSQMLSLVEVAAVLRRVLGRSIVAGQVQLAEWASAFPPGPARDGRVEMMEHYDSFGLPGGNKLILETILCREPRTIEGYFRDLLTVREASVKADDSGQVCGRWLLPS